MKTHPYLRAFLAGIFVPTLLLPLMLTGIIVLQLVLREPFPVERGLVFPMALVPALWGLWSMLWLWSRRYTRLPLGVHGALLPLLLLPGGAWLALRLGILVLASGRITWFHSISLSYWDWFMVSLVVAVFAAYYLLWKYVVGFVNRVLETA